jgi:hypothetical protein
VILEMGPNVVQGILVRGVIVTVKSSLHGALTGRMRAHGWHGWSDLELVKVATDSELIVLKCLDPMGMPNWLSLADNTEELKEGDLLVHLAYSDSERRRPTWRSTRGRFKSWNGSGVLAIDLEVEPNQSGSPVLDGYCRVIGLVTKGDDSETLLISVEEIHKVLAD